MKGAKGKGKAPEDAAGSGKDGKGSGGGSVATAGGKGDGSGGGSVATAGGKGDGSGGGSAATAGGNGDEYEDVVEEPIPYVMPAGPVKAASPPAAAAPKKQQRCHAQLQREHRLEFQRPSLHHKKFMVEKVEKVAVAA